MEQQLIQIINTITPDLWFLFFKFIVVFLIILMIRDFLSNLSNYIQFRTSKFVGKNVEIKIDNSIGFIEDYNLRAIFIRLKGGNLKIIPMERWKYQNWEIKEHYKEIFGENNEIRKISK